MRSFLSIVLFLGLILSATTLKAQTFRGTLLGTVSDSKGAVVPGADVIVTNMDTGIARTVQTNAQGDFFAPELPIGRYSVKVNHPGFNAFLTDDGQCRTEGRRFKPIGHSNRRALAGGDILGHSRRHPH